MQTMRKDIGFFHLSIEEGWLTTKESIKSLFYLLGSFADDIKILWAQKGVFIGYLIIRRVDTPRTIINVLEKEPEFDENQQKTIIEVDSWDLRLKHLFEAKEKELGIRIDGQKGKGGQKAKGRQKHKGRPKADSEQVPKHQGVILRTTQIAFEAGLQDASNYYLDFPKYYATQIQQSPNYLYFHLWKSTDSEFKKRAKTEIFIDLAKEVEKEKAGTGTGASSLATLPNRPQRR